MSASREKQNRQARSSSGWTDPKTAREAQQRREERRTNALYGAIAAVFAVAAVAAVVWRSNVIPRNAAAAVIDGQKYTAAEVGFYYQNAYSSYYSYLSALGADPSKPLDEQPLDASTAAMLGMDVDAGADDAGGGADDAAGAKAADGEAEDTGLTWKDFFLRQGLQQMATVQNGLKAAEAEGFAYPAGVQAQYEDSMESLRSGAKASGMSVNAYLARAFGSYMTEKVYGEQTLRMLKFQAYADAKEASFTYDDAKLDETYAASPDNYDKVSYEAVSISGAAEGSTDADGKSVDPTEEETAAAKAEAKAAADEMLAAFRDGEKLETLAGGSGNAAYSDHSDGISYTGDALTAWLFDAARKDGDSEVIESGSTYYVAVYHDRFRDEYNTVNVRHLLVPLAEGTIAEGEDGYDAEQAQLKSDAHAKAEELWNQWKSGNATVDSFAALAMEESSDSSRYDGGLYTQVYQGQMVDEFNDWCFDSGRKSGDNGVVDTRYGSHVMYFVGEDLPRWKAQVSETLREADYSDWQAGLSASAVIEQKDFGINFVG